MSGWRPQDTAAKFLGEARVQKLLEQAFPDPAQRDTFVARVRQDFGSAEQAGRPRHPSPTFELVIRAGENRCEKCGRGVYLAYTSDAGEKWCLRCVLDLEDNVAYGRRLKEADAHWISETVQKEKKGG